MCAHNDTHPPPPDIDTASTDLARPGEATGAGEPSSRVAAPPPVVTRKGRALVHVVMAAFTLPPLQAAAHEPAVHVGAHARVLTPGLRHFPVCGGGRLWP